MEFLRQKLIRTGRDRQETAKIRQAVDEAFERVVKRGRTEQDLEKIKEEIFLEIAQRLEQLNENEIQVRTLFDTLRYQRSSTFPTNKRTCMLIRYLRVPQPHQVQLQ